MHPNRYELSPQEAEAIAAQAKQQEATAQYFPGKSQVFAVGRFPGPADIEFSYGEDKVLVELQKYIADTYGQHYAKAGGQLFDQFIDVPEEVVTFCKLNAMKYLKRYGFKDGHNRKDIMKALHYCVLMMCFADIADSKRENT